MENLELPFNGPGFLQAWNEWVQFRKESKFKKYVPTGLKKTFTMLKNISNNDEATAVLILNQSMEQGWQGLFPLKQNNGAVIKTLYPAGGNKESGSVSGANIEALRNW